MILKRVDRGYSGKWIKIRYRSGQCNVTPVGSPSTNKKCDNREKLRLTWHVSRAGWLIGNMFYDLFNATTMAKPASEAVLYAIHVAILCYQWRGAPSIRVWFPRRSLSRGVSMLS